MNKNVEIIYNQINEDEKYNETIETVIDVCFKEEKLIGKGIYVSITLTSPEIIRKINKQYRNIDKSTDVLSFPMFEKDELQGIKDDILGDIVISIEQVKKQAEEYEHSFERELAYMVVHGFYHLMGYDHITDNLKEEMRIKEENILTKIGLVRE